VTTETHYDSNSRIDYTKDATGTKVDFTAYDKIGRVKTAIKRGATGTSYTLPGDITTTYVYDAANHTVQTDVAATGVSNLTSTAYYDLSGRIVSQVSNATASDTSKRFTTSYDYSAGGKVVTTTFPGGLTKSTEVYTDGQAKSVSGTAAVSEYYQYWIDSGTGQRACQSVFGGNFSAWTNTNYDWLGRKIAEWTPRWDGNAWAKFWYFNGYGKLYKQTQSGFADTLYYYDVMGVLRREGLDLGGTSGALDDASVDRITDYAWSFTGSGTNWWRSVTTTAFVKTDGTSKQVKKVDTQLSGFSAAASGYTRLARTDTTDVFGNVSSVYTEVNRTTTASATTSHSPASNIDAVQSSINGSLVTATDSAGVTTTYGYDAFGRQATSTDPRTGATYTTYVNGTSLVDSVKHPSTVVLASYAYDSAGRVSRQGVSNPNYGLGGDTRQQLYTYFEYGDRNQTKRVWGDTEFPVSYTYDGLGHQLTMATYRGGSGWAGTGWPTSPGTADTTTWNYNAATNLLASKVDAAGNTITYTYTIAGQPLTRQWARTFMLSGVATRVKTTYSYDSGTGELTGKTYNDGTGSVAFTYDRLGDTYQVTDDTGQRTFNYNLSGTLELQSEDLPPGFFNARRITYPIASSVVLGRPTGLQLGTSSSATAEQNVVYAFDDASGGTGRLSSITAAGQVFAYAYTSASHLIEKIENSTLGYKDVRLYDPSNDWTDSRETTWGTGTGSSRAKFAYVQDSLGRVSNVTKTGTMFDRYSSSATKGLVTNYGYDDRSEVTADASTELDTAHTAINGRSDSHAYDTIGNRVSVTHNSHTFNYNPSGHLTNNLNQYLGRTFPGYFDVGGASTGTTVTISRTGGSTDTAARNGQHFFDAYALTNTSNAVAASLSVSDGTTSTPWKAFVPVTPELFGYDLDGNLTADGRWKYTYDAENRLTAVETLRPSALADADNQRLEFKYDYLGRRVEKLVRTGFGTSGYSSTATSDEKSIWSGWMLIARLDGKSSNALIASHYWGPDLSGSLQGAGCVGGLLMTSDGGHNYLPVHDAMGNVHGLITATSVTLSGNAYAAGDMVAAYEYDAFGQNIRESGDYAAYNPFRYSTKYTDIETGLVYFGHRFYSPSLGRFINKDPIEEQGGLNLYGFCANNGVNHWDYLGNTVYYIDIGGGKNLILNTDSNENAKASGHIGVNGGANVNVVAGHTPGDDYVTGTAVWSASSSNSLASRVAYTGTSTQPTATNIGASSGSLLVDSMVVNGSLTASDASGYELSTLISRITPPSLAIPNSEPQVGSVMEYYFGAGSLLGRGAGELFYGDRTDGAIHLAIGALAAGMLIEGGRAGVANPVPRTLTRVIPGEGPFPTLGPPGSADVYVTGTNLSGLSLEQISQTLTITPAPVYTVVEFPTPTQGLATPVFRTDPGFVGGGQTAGGATEFVVPNASIPPGAKTTVVRAGGGKGGASQ
jgi:RHS repeat-associated protein